MNSLNLHRGKGMANMYSWSSKRSYKNVYVWHDVTEDDLTHPTSGHDYILKGTKLLRTSPDIRSYQTNSMQTPTTEINNIGEDSNVATATLRRRNQSWSSFGNPQEYVVYKCESSRELAANFAADAGTQTEEKGGSRSFGVEREKEISVGQSVELSREEIVQDLACDFFLFLPVHLSPSQPDLEHISTKEKNQARSFTTWKIV